MSTPYLRTIMSANIKHRFAMGECNSDSDDSDELGRLAYQSSKSKTAKLREASKTVSLGVCSPSSVVAANNETTRTTTTMPETVGSYTLLNNSVTQTVLSSRDYPPVSSLGKREYSSSSVHKKSTTTKTPSSGGYEHEYYYDPTTKRVVDATTKRVVAHNVGIKHDELKTSPIQQESLLYRPQIPMSQKECPKYSQNNNTNTKCPPPIFIPKVGIISKKKQKKSKENSNKHLLPTKPYTDYTMFFRLEQAYITQTTTGEVDPEIIKLLDPNHTDDVEFPRPEKYKDVIMPPYWYSSSHKKAAYKKRKHRKRKGSERLDLKTLSQRISAGWRDLQSCAAECTEKWAILEYCRMLACSEAEKYQAKIRAQSRAQSMKEEHETQMVRVKEQQQRLQAMTRDAETGEQNQRKLAWAEFTSAEVTDEQGIRLLTAMKYAQTGLPSRDSSTH